MKYKCGDCGRFIKWETRQATAQQMEEEGYPDKYDVPICLKCGELAPCGVEKGE